MKPEDFNKFQTCNAAICPLDPYWPAAAHLPGEKVCHYLLATGKAGADERYADDPVFGVVKAVAEAIIAKWSNIRMKVQEASRYGLKKPPSRRPRPAKAPCTEITSLPVAPRPSEGQSSTYVPPANASGPMPD